jgi:transposase-like protein
LILPAKRFEFMLSPKRDLTVAKLFLRLALSGGAPSPRVINLDGHPAYASAITELKQSGDLGSPLSLPNRALSEQHHRAGSSL